MTIARTDLYSSSAGSGSSHTTSSITPTGGANAAVVVDIIASKTGAGINQPTVSGAGLVWTLVDEIEYLEGVAWQITTYIGLDTNGTATPGTLSISFGGQSQNGIGVIVTEYTGVDASSFANCVIQHNTNSVSGSSSGLAVTLASFADATNNAAVGSFSHRVDTESLTGDTGYATTLITRSTTPVFQAISEWNTGQDTSVACSYNSSVRGCIGIAFELAAAAATGSGIETFERTAQPRPYQTTQLPPPDPRLWPGVLDAPQPPLPLPTNFRGPNQPDYLTIQRWWGRAKFPFRRQMPPKLQRSGRIVIDTITSQRVGIRFINVYAVQPYDATAAGDTNVDDLPAWFADTAHLQLAINEWKANCINGVRILLRNDTSQTYKNRLYNLVNTLADNGMYSILCPFDTGGDSFSFGNWPTQTVSNDTATACGNYVRQRWEEMGKPDYVMFETVNEPTLDVNTPADVTAWLSGVQAEITAMTSSGYTGIIFVDGMNFSWTIPDSTTVASVYSSWTNTVLCSHRYATGDGSSLAVEAVTGASPSIDADWVPMWPDRSLSEGFAFVQGEFGIYNNGFGTGGSDNWTNNLNGWGKGMIQRLRDAYQAGKCAGFIGWLWAWDDATDGITSHHGNDFVDDLTQILATTTTPLWTINAWGTAVYGLMREACNDFPPLPLPQSDFPRLYSQQSTPYRRFLNSTVMDFTPAATPQLFTQPLLSIRPLPVQQSIVQRIELWPDVLDAPQPPLYPPASPSLEIRQYQSTVTPYFLHLWPDILDALQPPIPYPPVTKPRPYQLSQSAYFLHLPSTVLDAPQIPLYPFPLGFNQHQYTQVTTPYILRLWPEVLNNVVVVTPDNPLWPYPTTNRYTTIQSAYKLSFPINLFTPDIPILFFEQLEIPPYRTVVYADQHKRIPLQVLAPEPAPLRLLQYRGRRPWYETGQRGWRRWLDTGALVLPLTPVPGLDQDALYAIIESPSGYRVILVSPTTYEVVLSAPTVYRVNTNKINRG